VALLLLHGTEARAQFIAVSGSLTLRVSTALAGAAPSATSDASSTYFMYAPTAGTRLVAQLNTAMPSGLTLTANLSTKSGISQGAVTLDTSPQSLVTGISQGFYSSSTITYRLVATLAAGVVTVQTRTVTFTLIAGP